jgi:hypothetical protein
MIAMAGTPKVYPFPLPVRVKIRFRVGRAWRINQVRNGAVVLLGVRLMLFKDDAFRPTRSGHECVMK